MSSTDYQHQQHLDHVKNLEQSQLSNAQLVSLYNQLGIPIHPVQIQNIVQNDQKLNMANGNIKDPHQYNQYQTFINKNCNYSLAFSEKSIGGDTFMERIKQNSVEEQIAMAKFLVNYRQN